MRSETATAAAARLGSCPQTAFGEVEAEDVVPAATHGEVVGRAAGEDPRGGVEQGRQRRGSGRRRRGGNSMRCNAVRWKFASVVVSIAVSKVRGCKLRLPPGPVPVPIFGNWLQVGDDLNHSNLAVLARKFGDIFLLRMGQRNLVAVSSPPLAREVLHTQGVEFGSRTRNVVFDIFTGKGQDMVFTVYGEHWRKMRRIMTVPFFTNKVVPFLLLLGVVR